MPIRPGSHVRRKEIEILSRSSSLIFFSQKSSSLPPSSASRPRDDVTPAGAVVRQPAVSGHPGQGLCAPSALCLRPHHLLRGHPAGSLPLLGDPGVIRTTLPTVPRDGSCSCGILFRGVISSGNSSVPWSYENALGPLNGRLRWRRRLRKCLST